MDLNIKSLIQLPRMLRVRLAGACGSKSAGLRSTRNQHCGSGSQGPVDLNNKVEHLSQIEILVRLAGACGSKSSKTVISLSANSVRLAGACGSKFDQCLLFRSSTWVRLAGACGSKSVYPCLHPSYTWVRLAGACGSKSIDASRVISQSGSGSQGPVDLNYIGC